jgi:hypothetical protein
MATWSRRERVTRIVEWTVPAPPPFGADWNQVFQAFHQAERELRDAGQIPEGAEPYDNQIRFRTGDDEIIISYEIKES